MLREDWEPRMAAPFLVATSGCSATSEGSSYGLEVVRRSRERKNQEKLPVGDKKSPPDGHQVEGVRCPESVLVSLSPPRSSCCPAFPWPPRRRRSLSNASRAARV